MSLFTKKLDINQAYFRNYSTSWNKRGLKQLFTEKLKSNAIALLKVWNLKRGSSSCSWSSILLC